ncbi:MULTISPECIES: hypothetical protein [unclassified Streptomyces]|uniref:hypothetical protein n=1 Tax=unclassified Streptomyces TaxID=2593676 RepID=UPI0038184696
MRNDVTSALATGEISDSELDNISGGLAAGAGGGAHISAAGLNVDATLGAHVSLAPGQAQLSGIVAVHAAGA